MSQSEVKPDQSTATKFCHIVKRADFDGYGFNLHSEKAKPGQFIGKVDSNSPAESAGLKEGDRIVEVNGVAIGNESHKQVVQRIKAIANEVRLLLIDVDGKGDSDKQTINGNVEETVGTSQTVPGISENINTITMVSTKRVSQDSQHSMATVSANGSDQIDNANTLLSNANTNNNDTINTTMKTMTTNIPPPPSATMAANNKMAANGSAKEANNASSSSNSTTSANANGTGSIKAGSLQLPMTAAEMRAKLASKKKYDPKNESVDLRKKYEIVQKL
uniref:WW domain-containing protein n=1 Tax=Glossina morsitans morsitans TaxID=37546 RepID=D3TLC3_GLOMM